MRVTELKFFSTQSVQDASEMFLFGIMRTCMLQNGLASLLGNIFATTQAMWRVMADQRRVQLSSTV